MPHIEQRYHWDEAETHYGALMTAVERARRDCPTGKLGVGGSWAGKKTLFEDVATAPLVEWIQSLLPTLQHLDGWGFLMRTGDSVEVHHHGKSHRQKGLFNDWAGVYYLECPEGSGILCPEADPDEGQPPRNGDLVIFRAHMRHYVSSHESRYPRYSIAFNAVEKR